MGRRNLRIRRKLTVLGLIALLLLLLEMNRFLPGGWPGGGGEGGFRSSDTLGLDGDPLRADDTRLKPPPDPSSIDELVKALDKDVVLVQVFDARGNELDDWSLGVGEDGPEDQTPSKVLHGLRRGRKQKEELSKNGFRVRGESKLTAHMLAGPASGQKIWRAVLPRASVPSRKRPAPIEIEIRSKASGELIPGRLEVQPPWSTQGDVVDAPKGTATLSAAGLLQVRAKSGAVQVDTYVHPRNRAPVVIEIDDAPRKMMPGATIRSIRSPDGQLLEGEQKGASSWPASGYEQGAWAELHAESTEKATIAWGERLQDLGDDVVLPEHRHLEVFVTDTQGKRMSDAVVRTRYALPVLGFELDEPFFVETQHPCDEGGRARPAVPTGVDVTLIVEAPGRVPQVFEIGTGTTVLDRIKLKEGRPLTVRIIDEGGDEIADPTVVVRAKIGDVVVERDARGPFPDGMVEVYATAPGHVWGKALVRVSNAPVQITLVEARKLDLRVESPLGLPLEGVRVEVTPTDDEDPLVAPPHEVDDRTDAKGAFALDHLPDRVYRIRLSKPGYQTETLYRIRLGAVTYFTTLVPE